MAFTISSSKDLKKSQQLHTLQNTAFTTSDGDSELKGLSPVSKGRKNY
jgi:hypothetical protein